MHSAPTEWQTARVAYEWVQGFQFRRASLGERLRFPTNTAEESFGLGREGPAGLINVRYQVFSQLP